jgi:hypothetical protein
MRGAVWALKGDLNSAVTDVSEAIRLNASEASSYKLRSSIYGAMKERKKSAADTEMVLKLAEKKLQSVDKKLQDLERKERKRDGANP